MELLSRAVSANDYLIRSSRFDSIFALPRFATLSGDGLFFYVEIRDTNAGVNTFTPVKVLKVGSNLTVASCPSPPQIIDGPSRISSWKEVLNALLLFLKKNYNCMVVTMEQRPNDPQFIRGKLDGCKLSYHYDVMIDLSKELRTIYYNMDKRHRYTLRESSGCSDVELSSGDWLEKAGPTIRQGRSEESLHEFNALWIESMARIYNRMSQLRKLVFVDSLPLNDLVTKFRKLYPYGLFKLFTVYDEDEKPGASAIFYTSDNFTKIPIAYWTEIASSADGNKKGLPTLLLRYTIQWFKEHEFRRFYMGGYYPSGRNIKPEKGHTLYKQGFGAQMVSGLSVLWLSQPISTIYDVASFFTQPIDPINFALCLKAKLLGSCKRLFH